MKFEWWSTPVIVLAIVFLILWRRKSQPYGMGEEKKVIKFEVE